MTGVRMQLDQHAALKELAGYVVLFQSCGH